MTTLELKITDNKILKNVLKVLSQFKWIKIEKKEEYNDFEKWLIESIKDINLYKNWKKDLQDINTLLEKI